MAQLTRLTVIAWVPDINGLLSFFSEKRYRNLCWEKNDMSAGSSNFQGPKTADALQQGLENSILQKKKADRFAYVATFLFGENL